MLRIGNEIARCPLQMIGQMKPVCQNSSHTMVCCIYVLFGSSNGSSTYMLLVLSFCPFLFLFVFHWHNGVAGLNRRIEIFRKLIVFSCVILIFLFF